MVDALYIVIAMVGMIVELAGFLMNRDKKLSGNAEWRGSVNAKVDTIYSDLGDVPTNISVCFKVKQRRPFLIEWALSYSIV